MPAMDEVLIPVTCSGVRWPASVPSPSCPEALPPHAHTDVIAVIPLVRVARDASNPAEMLVTWDRPVTWTGISLLAVVPSPSWPEALPPQAQTVPSERSARLNMPPAEILVTPLSPG